MVVSTYCSPNQKPVQNPEARKGKPLHHSMLALEIEKVRSIKFREEDLEQKIATQIATDRQIERG